MKPRGNPRLSRRRITTVDLMFRSEGSRNAVIDLPQSRKRSQTREQYPDHGGSLENSLDVYHAPCRAIRHIVARFMCRSQFVQKGLTRNLEMRVCDAVLSELSAGPIVARSHGVG